jgi:hypothetical protein
MSPYFRRLPARTGHAVLLPPLSAPAYPAEASLDGA